MRRITTRLLFMGAAGLVLASCGEVAERATEEAIEQSAGGGEVDLDEDGSVSFENEDGSFSADADGNLNIESEDGSFNLDSQSGELPDDFPDISLPDGFKVQNSSTQTSGKNTIYTVAGLVDDDPADLLDDLIGTYESEGYEVEGQFNNTSGDIFTGSASFVGAEYRVTIGVNTANEGGSTVSVNVSPAER
ncbi:MAG: hypothetical protein U5K30_06000 [Acidimicrobiales bacterium]|nr:hypothetical protein [Acidimicrobiales bacterium]